MQDHKIKKKFAYLYRSNPAANALPLVGARPLSDNFLTCNGTAPVASTADAAAAASDIFAAIERDWQNN